MNVIDVVTISVAAKQSLDLDRSREEFEITKVSTVGNKFNITIQNIGQIPVNVTRLWVENVSDSNLQNFRYQINDAAGPGQTITNIGQNIPLTAMTDQGYKMKLVTERGNSEEFFINFAGQQPMLMQLYASPTKISSEYTTTLIYEVVNNMTSDTVLTNVKPKIKETATGAIWERVLGPTPTSVDFLEKGDTALFKWVYKLTGDEGDKVKFETYLENGVQNNNATASVELFSVLLSKTSITSLEAEGLICCISAEELFMFHDENTDTPTGYRQMDNRNADISGSTVTLDSANNDLAFITLNDTRAKTISTGNWDVALRYFSAPVPVSLLSNLPEVIYHFQDNSSPEDNSGSINATMTLGDSGCSAPTFNSTAGPHGTGVYHFTDDHCMNADIFANINDITGAPDSTAGWFKLDGTTGTRTIYSAEGGGPYYKIFVDSTNKLVFEYQSSQNESTRTTCTGTTTLLINTWYHFVASRPGGHTCELYINGTDDNPTKVIGGGETNVNVSGNAFIGSLDNLGNDYFVGWIDDIIHWNNYDLTLAQIIDLNNTNYGPTAHKIDFKTYRTDQNGNNEFIINQTSNAVILQFKDGKDGSVLYDQFNYTFTTTQSVILSPQDRMGINMTHDSGLGVDLRIDDDAIFGGQVSFMKIPDVDQFFSSYWQYDNSGDLQFSFRNNGPIGFWVTFAKSRAVFEDVATGTGYGSMMITVNATSDIIVNHERDSGFIETGDLVDVFFKIPDLKITRSSSTVEIIPDGIYRMNVVIVGLDSVGGVIYRNFDIGIVRVI